jgi:hypothetical protein
LKLYAFQLAQAQPTVSEPLAKTVLPKPVVPVAKPWVQDWAANDFFSPMSELDDDHLDLASWSVPPTPPACSRRATVTPYTDWTQSTRPTKGDKQESLKVHEKPCMQIRPTPKTITQDTAVEKATAFMQTKPGGPLQVMDRDMNKVERRVGTTLEKKGVTSVEGMEALQHVSTSTAARNKKRKSVSTANVKQKKTTPPKKTGGGRPKQKKAVKPTEERASKQVVAPVVATCKYGCSHGGLRDLIQMTTSDTKHYLTPGRYMHQKCCTDCNTLIGTLFTQSNSRALFYYCQVDYREAELDDDNKEKAAVACSCVLCITCYFKRDTIKAQATGTNKRTSSRGRVA